MAKVKQRAYNDLYTKLDSKGGDTDSYRLAREMNEENETKRRKIRRGDH